MLYKLDRSGDHPEIHSVQRRDELCYQPGRRRVVLFPGAGLDITAKALGGEAKIAGSIKYMEQALASSRSGDTPIDIYVFLYPESFYEMQQSQSHGKRVHYMHGRDDPHFLPTKRGKEGLAAIEPLLLQDGETFSDLTPPQLTERLNTLTLCGHSYGSVMLQHIADTLAYRLRAAGWDETAIASTMKEVVAISVANIARTDYAAPNFTHYYFVGTNDTAALQSIARDKPEEADPRQLLKICGYQRVSKVMEQLGVDRATPEVMAEVAQQVDARRKKGVMPKPIFRTCPSGYSVHAVLPDKEIRWMERTHDGREICRVLTQDEARQNNTPIVHDFRTFLHGNHALGEVLINAMNNAVLREPGIGDGHQLSFTTPATRQQHHHRLARHKEAEMVSERGFIDPAGTRSL